MSQHVERVKFEENQRVVNFTGSESASGRIW